MKNTELLKYNVVCDLLNISRLTAAAVRNMCHLVGFAFFCPVIGLSLLISSQWELILKL
jgi:hypothetical protein